MKKIRLPFVILILLIFAGCTRDVLETIDDRPINRDGSIAFRTSAPLTRATPQENLTAYGSINLVAYSHSGKYADGKSLYREAVLNKDGAGWDYTPRMFWPDGRNLSFLAYAIESTIDYASKSGDEGVFVTDNGEGTAPTIEYVVPTSAEKQPDLIVTALLDPVKSASIVTLPMKHALTNIGFRAFGFGQRLSNVRITGVAEVGTLELDTDGIAWNTEAANGDGEFNGAMIRETIVLGYDPVNILKANGSLMMIPQLLTERTKLAFELNGVSFSLPIHNLLPSWEAGKKVVYQLDCTSDVPIVTLDFSGDILSNSYILTPSNDKDIELKIPINRVNQFWGHSDYGTTNFADNIIHPNEEWRVSILWYDTQGLVTSETGGGVYISKGKPTNLVGINDYFSVVIPKGFTKRGNIVVGLAKGTTEAHLVNGGSTDDAGVLLPGAGAKIVWSWHIWVTDYNPYAETTAISGPGGAYMDVLGGILWQGKNYTFTFGGWAGGVVSGGGTATSMGNTIWTNNDRFLMDRPIGVKDLDWKDARNSDSNQTGNGILYYQFGRKDPFPADVQLYTLRDGVEEPVDYSPTANGVEAKKNIWWTIYNPLRHVYVPGSTGPTQTNGYGDWAVEDYGSSESEDILWFDPITKNNPTAKSIFDPSPLLFRVPRVGAFNCLADPDGPRRLSVFAYTAGPSVNSGVGLEDPRATGTTPYTLTYTIAQGKSVNFYAWGSRFWRTGRWNDAVGFNGQYWMSATVPNTIGWDFYLLNDPTTMPINGVTAPRVSPNEPGIRSSTMVLMPVQDFLPAGANINLPTWSYKPW